MFVLNDKIKIYLDMAWRRKWWIVAPMVLSVVAAQMAFERLPKLYRASTLVLVVRQKVPERVAPPMFQVSPEERMASLREQILSRQYLENVVTELGLVSDDTDQRELEAACARLSQQVEIAYDWKNFSYFKIKVEHENPEIAADVANRLAKMFIEQNSKMRSDDAERTLLQVEEWLGGKKSELHEAEQKIADYRRRHIYELPERQEANMALLVSKEKDLDRVTDEIQLLEQRIDALVAQSQAADALQGDPDLFPESVGIQDPALRRLSTLETELSDLLLTYTNEHPRVRRKRDEITEFKRRHPELAAAVDGAGPGQGDVETAAVGVGAALANLQSQAAGLRDHKAKLEREIDELRVRIDRAHIHELALADLKRDLDVLQKDHDALVAQRETGRRSLDLERKSHGETFRVQDYAHAPSRPFKPQPKQIYGMFLAAGLAIGFGIALLLELLDPSLKSDVEFRQAYPGLPLLATVPNFELSARRSPLASATKARRDRRKS